MSDLAQPVPQQSNTPNTSKIPPCPKCGDSNSQPCEAVWMEGTTDVKTKTRGGGVILHNRNQMAPMLTSSTSTSVQQTQLARLCSPPPQPGLLGRYAISSMAKYRAKKGLAPDPSAWPAAYNAWKRRWICMRCHTFIDPDPNDSIQALNEAAAKAAAELKGPKTTGSTSADERWYDKTWLVFLLVFLFWPVGLYGLFKSKNIKTPIKIVVGVFFALFVIAIANAKAHKRGDDKRPHAEGTPGVEQR